MTVLEVIQKSSDFLAKKGVDSPRLQTELLLAHILKLPRMRLYLDFERQLADTEVSQLRDLVVRRSRREPLQHITGATSFCGLEIAVNPHVLIPRPETELLAELGWQFLLAAPKPGEGGSALNSLPRHGEATAGPPSTALDFGTGSGCIALALAAKCPTATVHALDVSPDALALARQNAERNKIDGRIQFHQGDGFSALPAAPAPAVRFDLIVSNPPYIASAEIATLQPEVRDFDPRLALDGGADGLDFYRRLAVQAAPFLKPGGRLMVEFGDGQAPAIRGLFEEQKWVVEAVTDDYSQRARILTVRR